MSDDASEPEDPSEDKHSWKRRMLIQAGWNEESITDELLAQTTIWENIKPEWRSEEVSYWYREIQ